MTTIKQKALEAGKKIYMRLIKHIEHSEVVNSCIGRVLFSTLAKAKISLHRNRPPVTVHIEPINICNARCVMCPYVLSKRKKGEMPIELYKRIIDECAGLGVRNVVVTGLGEPLLDKKIYEKLTYAVRAGLRTKMVTNASLLDDEAAERLLDTGLHELEFSVDGYDKQTYESIRKGLSYETVISNISNFLEKKARRGLNTPATLVNFVRFEYNRKDEVKFKKYWEKKVDFVRIAIARDWQGAVDLKGARQRFEYLSRRIPCVLLWLEMAVAFDGIAVACCVDWKRSLSIGNLAEQSVEDVWFGEKANRLREIHLKGRRCDITTCRNCEHFFRL